VLIAASALAGLGFIDCGRTPPPRTYCPAPNEDCCYESAALPSCMGDSACLTFPLGQVECSPKVQCTECTYGCELGACRSYPVPVGSGGNGGNGGLGGEGGLSGGGNP
jgi:hypothetical protein